jgi:hypothetical protein
MKRDTLLPDKQLAAIVTALYADADKYGWTDLPPTERSRQYGRWIDDPRVGKILTKYMTPEQARSWIKDGPMKEYANARRGTGRYARFGRQGGTGARDVVIAALGAGAKVLDGSEGVKPPHCYAVDATGELTYVAWGPATNFRNLLLAALRIAATEQKPAHIVVLEPPGHSTSTADSITHRAMTDRCQLHLYYLPEVVGQARGGQTNDA